MLKSLKARIAAGTFLTLFLFLALLGGGIYGWTKDRLWGEYMSSLELAARSIESQITTDNGFLEIYHDRLQDLAAVDSILLLQVINKNGAIVFGPKAQLDEFDYTPPVGSEKMLIEVDKEGEMGIGVQLKFVAKDEYQTDYAMENPYHASVILVKKTEPLLATLAAMRGTVIAAVLLSSVLGAGMLAILVFFFVRPIDELARAIGRIDHEKLSPAVQVRGLPSESQPVVDALNRMMENLKAAFDREKAFTSHVSHELRTPLTGLRTTLEVALENSESLEASRRAERTCLGIVKQTQRLVEKLLGLTRLRASSDTNEETELVNVKETLIDSWEAFGGTAQDKAIAVSWNCDTRLNVDVPYDFFLVIINNLLENAVNYCPVRGSIHIKLVESGGMVHTSVENSVSNLKEEDVDKLFDPFWRKDDSRSETGKHAGLGLAISQTMAAKCGGSLRAELVGEDRLKFAFSLEKADELTSVEASVLVAQKD